MWQLERDEQGFWMTSGKTRVGPWTRPGAARAWAKDNPPPEPEKRQPAKRKATSDEEE